MTDINSRKDIETLVNNFYQKVRDHNELGPIFNRAIPEDKWPSHLVKLADFWETNLFRLIKFNGNPTMKHKEVDAAEKGAIDQKHFGWWLQMWFETIDELFEGEIATKAKESARKMAHVQFMMIWKNRN